MKPQRLHFFFHALTIVFLAAAFANGTKALGEIKLPKVFGDNMVLQRERPVPVWGWAGKGDGVVVTFGDQSKEATAGDDGRWQVTLDALKASADPAELKIAPKSGGDARVIKNVLVGEVWLCSGQSNMEWSVRASNNQQQEIADANHPAIRLFHVPKVPATTPQDDTNANWAVCAPGTIPNFSAVGYFFGREIHKNVNVPVGLINSSWGGTRIEPWTPVVGFNSVESTRTFAERFGDPKGKHQQELAAHVPTVEAWAADAKKALAEKRDLTGPPKAPQFPNYGAGTPTGLYNGLIHPLVPFSFRGAIWYQGESNNGEGMFYHDKMKALINGWRSVFKNDEMPFYFVQLAPYKYGNGEQTLPYIWEAQTATLAVKNTGMAVITDIGNVNDIHPRNKQDVGKRLALWALAKTYGKKDLVYSGPLYKSMKVEGGKIRVSFDHAAGGLKSRDDKPLTDFTIAGEDGKFVAATAEIDGETVVASSDQVADPRHVRFGWHHMVNPNLANNAGLPASPFKTDKWLKGK